MSTLDIIVANVDLYLADPTSEAAQIECKTVAESLISSGVLVIKDSRATASSNSSFLDLLETYFAQPVEVLSEDLRPEIGYQRGVTLPNTEKPSCFSLPKCRDLIDSLDEEERPLDLEQHDRDPKGRFFWSFGKPLSEPSVYPVEAGAGDAKEDDGEKFEALNAPNVIPQAKGIKDVWEDKMEDWGTKMLQAVQVVSEMLAIGLGLPKDIFTRAGEYGPHLLAPTSSDLRVYGELNTILAGYHSDLNFLTIHGKSRYPGLSIWKRNTGKRVSVKVPDGCLLLQAGKQLEWISGGLIKAGYHEVAVTKGTLDAMARIKETEPERPLIRISSTMFWHLSSNYWLEAIPSLKEEAKYRFGEQEEYGRAKVGTQVKRELGLIALMTE